ncbi:MAG: hypothetical protein JSS35_14460, partial [Proteobacteria bacterium]|nr:hypothetical protein [Pseudomonadota bacterium]
MTKGIVRLLGVGVLVAAGFILTGAALEAAARGVAPEQQHNTCSLPDRHHELFKPNCVSAPMKMAESPWLRYAYNDCGYRTAEPCRLRQPGQRRVAVIGTSISYGLWVPYPQTWAARVGATLSARCGHPTDVQNLSFPASHDGPTALWHDIVDAAPRAMALQPDAVVTVVGPVDLGFYAAAGDGSQPPKSAAPPKSLKQRLIDVKTEVNASSSVSLFRHWWLSDPGRLVELNTQHDETNDFLRTPTPKAWVARLAIADDAFAKL